MSFEAAREAFRRGDVQGALPLLTAELESRPENVAAHLLLARAFLAGGQHGTVFQLLRSLVRRPELRAHAPLPSDELDALLIELFLAWGRSIEDAAFPGGELEIFGQAAGFYRGLPGRRSADIQALLDGLSRGRAITSVIADALRR